MTNQHSTQLTHSDISINKNQPNILLATINARYIHAAFGLRYLYANMAELQPNTTILEFNIKQQAEDICEKILEKNYAIVGFGVYIWNTELTCEVITLLKLLKPEIIIILGGPEVSYETKSQAIYQLADYIITGMADLTFYQTCKQLLSSKSEPKDPFTIMPGDKIIASSDVNLNEIKLPYQYYSDIDIAQRVLYVEASRGCPFKCEFCLSSLDKTAWPFSIDVFLDEMNRLYERGARHFKFVDRTFNLKVKSSLQILDFFLDKILHDDGQCFLHFELIPDNLPEPLKNKLIEFPEGCLQFEIGIQTFTPDVQERISRRQNNEKSKENIRWLIESTKAHLHTDLIFGLPGETMTTFEDSFNQLVALNPHEIQFGILKRLKGTPIIRHSEAYQLKFNAFSPYNILSNSDIDYLSMRKMVRFARFWDLIYNSGRFKLSIQVILADNPFARFVQLSDCIYDSADATHKISLQRLFEYVFKAMVSKKMVNELDMIHFIDCVFNDFFNAGFHHFPTFLLSDNNQHNEFVDQMFQTLSAKKRKMAAKKRSDKNTNKRQKQHLS